LAIFTFLWKEVSLVCNASCGVSDEYIDRVSLFLAQLNLPTTARWQLNATIVAGLNGSFHSYPFGIIVDADNNLYIAEMYNHRIVIVKPNSTTAVATIGTGAGSNATKFLQPSDVVVTSTAIYVMDTDNFRVQKLSRNSTNVTTVVGVTGR
jgi:hypothetical protein